MNPNCPRCRSRTLVPLCGGGVECLSCDYKEIRDDLELYAELMVNMPGIPLPTRVERHEVEVRRAGDVALAEEAAERHGVTLEDLRERMNWKRTTPSTRLALQETIADLTVSGLGIQRVAQALGKHPRTIGLSRGLAKGRARRKQVALHREVTEAMSEYKGRTPNTIVRKHGCPALP